MNNKKSPNILSSSLSLQFKYEKYVVNSPQNFVEAGHTDLLKLGRNFCFLKLICNVNLLKSSYLGKQPETLYDKLMLRVIFFIVRKLNFSAVVKKCFSQMYLLEEGLLKII